MTKRLFHANQKKDEPFKTELLGRDIARYLVEWNGESWVSYGPWLAHAVDERFFKGPRLVVQKIRNPMLKQRLVAGYLDDDETYSAGVLLNVIPKKDTGYSIFYVLGLMNSALLNSWYRANVIDVSIRVVDLKRLPIRRINFDDPADRARHDRMVALVTEMLDLQKEHAQAERAKEDRRHDLKRRIDQVDAAVDRLVYELYGLTEEEIKVVEGG